MVAAVNLQPIEPAGEPQNSPGKRARGNINWTSTARDATRAQPSRARGTPGPDCQPAKARSVGPTSRSSRRPPSQDGRGRPTAAHASGCEPAAGAARPPRNSTAGTAATGKPTRRGRLPASGYSSPLPVPDVSPLTALQSTTLTGAAGPDTVGHPRPVVRGAQQHACIAPARCCCLLLS